MGFSKKKIRLLFVSQQELSLKAGQTIGNTDKLGISDALIKQKNQVLQIATRRFGCRLNAKERIKYVRYIPIPGVHIMDGLSFMFFSFFAIFWYSFTFRPNIVVVDYSSTLSSIPIAILSRLQILKTLVVMDIRTVPVDTINKLKNKRYSLAIKVARILFHGMTTITPMLARETSKKFNIPLKKICIWSSGIDQNTFIPKNKKKTRDELGWPNIPIFIYHGTLSKNRGLQNLVKAMHLLATEGFIFRLILLGTGTARDELLKLIHKYKLKKTVILIDPVSIFEVPKYIAASDFGVVPLPDILWWRVSSPLKVLEYMSMNKFVICSDIKAHRKIYMNQKNVKFFNSIDSIGIATTLREILQNVSGFIKMSNEGRRFVLKNYTWDIQASRLVHYLNNLTLTSHLKPY